MDKALRHQVKMQHYRKRLRNYHLSDVPGKHYAFRESGKPCSCLFCDPHKYNPWGRHSTNVRAAAADDMD